MARDLNQIYNILLENKLVEVKGSVCSNVSNVYFYFGLAWRVAEEKCVLGAKVFSSKRAVPVTDLAAFADHVQSKIWGVVRVEKVFIQLDLDLCRSGYLTLSFLDKITSASFFDKICTAASPASCKLPRSLFP